MNFSVHTARKMKEIYACVLETRDSASLKMGMMLHWTGAMLTTSKLGAQLHIVDAEYCDFVVWNTNDIFIERIVPDMDFWDDVIPKAENFFRNCILPEVLGQQVAK